MYFVGGLHLQAIRPFDVPPFLEIHICSCSKCFVCSTVFKNRYTFNSIQFNSIQFNSIQFNLNSIQFQFRLANPCQNKDRYPQMYRQKKKRLMFISTNKLRSSCAVFNPIKKKSSLPTCLIMINCHIDLCWFRNRENYLHLLLPVRHYRFRCY